MQEFRDFLISNTLIPHEIPIGVIKRCATTDKPRKKNGAFYFTGYSGWCKNFGLGITVGWRSEVKVDPVKMENMRRENEVRKRNQIKGKREKQLRASETANIMLKNSSLGTTTYFTIKGFKGHLAPLYLEDDVEHILVPMYFKKEVIGIQKINPEGGKKFLYGQRTNDCHFPIGLGGRTFLCEGYLTGLTCHLLLNHLSINHNIKVCFSADNVLRLSKYFKDAFVIADNDESGVGERVAKESGFPYYLPETVGHDLNDEYVARGLFKTSQRLRKFFQFRG